MLFTDSITITSEALRAIDPDVPEVVENEGVAVDGDRGVGRQTWSACGTRILDALRTVSSGLYAGVGSPVAVVGATGLRARLNQVVVSESLRRWMLFSGLARFYSTVAGRRQSDRYASKAESALFDAEVAWRVFKADGVPICWVPLPRPGAECEFSGTWGTENLVVSSGGSFAAGETISVAVTWVDVDGIESDAGDIQTVAVNAGQRVTVDVSSLIAPGVMPPRPFGSHIGAAMRVATGWNVYAGPATAAYLNKQNTSPIGIDGTFVINSSPTVTTAPLMNGQTPDVFLPIQNILPRS